ncbi:GyrI-like domain-containing protein [Enterococcus sp. BWM-S5]|uniref:GyrI-like domain-containing protein n=1 Tax=Enterococcus larvae TaxID=2794352 RepID=A0ABS4CL39_9ENTE|nr:GyrI-like domain-containing protein [Enterococcus larvae]MBP1046672.1 GyrI-like domain-containing protein [Enterococcus larvae]
MNIEKITKPEQIIISITHTGLNVTELPKIIGPTFMEIGKYISEQGAAILSNPFVSFKNMDETGKLDESQIEMEIGFPVDKLIPENESIKAYRLPSYKAVSVLYVGDYDQGMIDIYRRLFEEIKANGGIFMNRSYEYYLSDEEIDLSKQETIIELPYR